MSCLWGLYLGLAILLAVFKLWDSDETYWLEILAFWEKEGQKAQALHLSSKLKHITRRIKERKKSIAESSVVNIELSLEGTIQKKCMVCQEFPYPENVIHCSAVCFLDYLNRQRRLVIICSLDKPLCNDLQFNTALAFVSEMCFCYRVKIHSDLATFCLFKNVWLCAHSAKPSSIFIHYIAWRSPTLSIA